MLVVLEEEDLEKVVEAVCREEVVLEWAVE